jgi:RNA polymerase sigma factor (sigma-70 family)
VKEHAPKPSKARDIPKKSGAKDKPSSRTKGTIDQYFSEMMQGEDLLTPAEELELGKKIQDSVQSTTRKLTKLLEGDLDLLASLGSYTASTGQENDRVLEARRRSRLLNPNKLRGEALASQIEELLRSEDGLDILKTYDPDEGGLAAERMVKANLRLVVATARKYVRPGGMPLNDLIQEGNFGLIVSVLRYDHLRGHRFSTYATWWIRHAILRAIADKAREIRIPVHMLDFSQRVAKTRARLTKKLGRAVTVDEVADAMAPENEAKKKRSSSSKEAGKKRKELPKKIDDMILRMQAPVSLQKLIYTENNETEFGELIPVESPEEPKPWVGLEEELREAMRNLTPTEQHIVRQRFGIGTKDEAILTFRELGVLYSLSRESIRQIQNSALAKLRRQLSRYIIT